MAKKEASKFYPRLFFSLLFIGSAVLGFFIIKPFLVAFLSGGVLAVLSYPLHKRLLGMLKSPWKAALAVTLGVMLLILIPLFFMLGFLSNEAYDIYQSLNGKGFTLGSDVKGMLCSDIGSSPCQFLNRIISMLPEKDLDFYGDSLIRRILEFITENFSQMIFSLPAITLNFFVTLFVMYYILKDHEFIISKVNGILPLRNPHKLHVVKKFKDVSFAVFYGHLFIALIQGAAAGIGYLLLGVHSPFLWASITALFALLPFFGTALIWAPLALNFIIQGFNDSDQGLVVRGILLILYGLLVVSTIDNVVRPKIISTHADVHPILVLLGVLGGLSLFGFVGLVLGPVMLALLMIFVEIYEEEKSEIKSYFE